MVTSFAIFYLTFFIITPWVFSDLREYQQINSTKTFSKQESILLVDGLCDFGSSHVINTSNKDKPNFIEMPPSMNKSGGIEFTYSFWMKLSDMRKDTVLFLKGTNPGAGMLSEDFSKATDSDGNVTIDHVVKCPMVQVSPEQVIVTFNSSREIHNELKFDIDSRNILQSTDSNPRWFLFNVVFREGDFTTEYGLKSNGIVVDLFINEQHVKNKFIEHDSIRLNKGDIHFFPKGSFDSDSAMGNLYYHNWAVNYDDVKKMWAAGFNDKACTVATKVQKGKIVTQVNDLGRHGAKFFI
jgi:hypothetical protein